MNINTIRKYCSRKKGVTEDFPFDEDTLVFKVMGKMFGLTSLSDPISINLKCDPEMAVELREMYDGVTPGYHMNKKYWNTVSFEAGIPEKEIFNWIDHSYEQVVKGLPKKTQEELKKL